MNTIKCIVVDDEELARALICSYIEKVDFLELVGSFENPLEAMNPLNEQKVDLLFLDIQMPEIKGTDFAKMVPVATKVIFTTAYTEYALEGYELNVLDYLLKPITFERFLLAVNKAKSPTSVKVDNDDTITVKSGYDLFKVKLSTIKYIESDSEYVVYYTGDKKIMSNQSLKSLEKTLPSTSFMRVHRSFIVNKNYVTGLKGRDLMVADKEIPVSDSYIENVKASLF